MNTQQTSIVEPVPFLTGSKLRLPLKKALPALAPYILFYQLCLPLKRPGVILRGFPAPANYVFYRLSLNRPGSLAPSSKPQLPNTAANCGCELEHVYILIGWFLTDKPITACFHIIQISLGWIHLMVNLFIIV